MNEKEMRDFMSEGLRNYPSAYDAITLFEGKIEQAIQDALSSNDWDSIRPKNIKPKIKRMHEVGYYWCYTTPRFIAGGSDVGGIEVGIWWETPHAEKPAVVYSGIYGKSKKKASSHTPSAPVRIISALSGTADYLIVDIDPDKELAEHVKLVLKALNDYLSLP